MQHPQIRPDQRSSVKTLRHWILPVVLSLIVNVGILQLLVVMLAALEPVATEYSRIDVRLLQSPKQEPPPQPVAKAPEPVVKPPEPKSKPMPPPKKAVKTPPPLPKKTLEPPAPEPPKDIAAPSEPSAEPEPVQVSKINEAPTPVANTAAPPQPKNEVVPLFRLTRMPKIVDYNLETLKRFYPEEERDFGKEATVEAMILVDENGDVVEVDIIKSAGERFDAAAKKALLSKALVIQPGYIGDRPVAARVPIPITFNLTD